VTWNRLSPASSPVHADMHGSAGRANGSRSASRIPISSPSDPAVAGRHASDGPQFSQEPRLLVIDALSLRNMTASVARTVNEPGTIVWGNAGLNRSQLAQAMSEFLGNLTYMIV
jgi:hypothetical protein